MPTGFGGLDSGELIARGMQTAKMSGSGAHGWEPQEIAELARLFSCRLLNGFILGQLAFYHWIDFADRHVKVVAIGPADRARRE